MFNIYKFYYIRSMQLLYFSLILLMLIATSSNSAPT